MCGLGSWSTEELEVLSLTDSACAHLKIASDYNLMEAKQLMNLYCKQESIFMSPYD